jgi:hypothetical protein
MKRSHVLLTIFDLPLWLRTYKQVICTNGCWWGEASQASDPPSPNFCIKKIEKRKEIYQTLISKIKSNYKNIILLF